MGNPNRVGAATQQSCQDNGLMVRALSGNSVAFCPPLIITESQVDEIVEKFGKALDETATFVAREKMTTV